MTNNQEEIIFKWRNDVILILLENKITDEEEIIKTLMEKIKNSHDFFKNKKNNLNLKLKFEGRDLSNEAKNKIKNFLEKKLEINIELADEIINKNSIVHKEISTDISNEKNSAKIYKGTVRSGQLIDSKENLIILGDVNPGAEVRANNDIYVFGNLKGIVHAGQLGNINSIIIALKLTPTQLRIANIITRPPDFDEIFDTPEIAYVENGQIFIKNYIKK
ncbi:MAG: hypothetical protein LBJ09_03575 [Clostridiales bacterium]|jgi:septum site-determining protein MinC|nr:hypothetical protein [Clostridiales bacterium]